MAVTDPVEHRRTRARVYVREGLFLVLRFSCYDAGLELYGCFRLIGAHCWSRSSLETGESLSVLAHAATYEGLETAPFSLEPINRTQHTIMPLQLTILSRADEHNTRNVIQHEVVGSRGVQGAWASTRREKIKRDLNVRV